MEIKKTSIPREKMEKKFQCDICMKVFTQKRNMLRHRDTHMQTSQHVCDYCNKSFKRKSNLIQHQSFVCKVKFQQPTERPLSNIPSQDGEDMVEVMTALENRIKTYVVKSPAGDIVTCLQRVKPQFDSKIKEILTRFTALKFNLFVECEFTNPSGETCTRNFKTKNVIVYRTSDVMEILTNAIDKIITEKSESQMKKSGWAFDKVLRLELRINKYNPLKGSSFIKLPLHTTSSITNVCNSNDEYCFKYAIQSRFVKSHPERVSSYINNDKLNNMYNWDCVSYPVQLKDIHRFETANNVSINVFSLNEQDEVYPLRICDEECKDHFDLLFVSNEKTSHYCYINNFARLVHSQLTSYHGKLTICKRCFAHFDDRYGTTGEEKLAKHKDMCMAQSPARCEIPDYDISFKNSHRSKKIRFIIYADFETMLEPIQSCAGNPEESWTKAYQQHTPYSYAYLLKDSEDEHTQLRVYRGPDAAEQFMKSVVKDIELVDRVLFGNKKLNVPTLTPEQQYDFDNAKVCHICKKGEFTEVNYKVRNHCHVSGDYLGVAHRKCNLFFQDQNFIACFIHNLSGYDGHFLVRELGYDKNNIRVIPNTDEKYISFSKLITVKHARNKQIELRFLDSFRFMQASLSTLANNLSRDKFYETQKHFPDNFDLVTKKCFFPYEFITSMEKLDQEVLPPKSSFYSKLSGEDISDESYEHAKAVWKAFNVKTLGEYSDIYVTTDVLILCDTFEAFRAMCLETYDLDPAYYFTIPGLAFDAMLKYTGVTLELMKDMDMVMMVEKGIRGGVTQCVMKRSVANNKYLGETFDQNNPSKYLMYVDANNLYAHSLSRQLPYKDFEWCDVSNLDITKIPENAPEGLIVEVDIEYPEMYHDKHSDFAFCTENKIPPDGKTPKLLATVENKTSYVIHYVALQQAISHGLVLKKIHRAIKFKQSAWMKPYIDMNTEKRKLAKNDFEKDFWKLMSNSVYGKTMEGVRDRLDIRLVSDAKKAEKLIAKPNFLQSTIYHENLVAIQMSKTKILFNKPIYCGLSVLDLSKTTMYSFHYDVMKPFYNERIKICYMDTDAFIYEVETEDIYEDFKDNFAEHLDTSGYPKDHPLYDEKHKKVVGKFKDELCGNIITDYVGLRSKMYAIKSETSTIKKLKGIKKAVIKKQINFDDYVNAFNKGETTYTENYMITSTKHQVQTVCMNKLTLSSHDDKRVPMPDNVHTLPYGHWRLRDKGEEPPNKRPRLQ